VTTTSQPRAARGRRVARPSGDDRELAILETATRLLDERPIHEISVDDLAKGAGISRPTFYFYFPSKDAVLMTLIERVIIEADSALAGISEQPLKDRHAFWRTVSTSSLQGSAHTRECLEPDTRRGRRFRGRRAVVAVHAEVDRQHRRDHRGRAGPRRGPVTLPAHDLATALNLLNERVLMAAFADERPAVPEDHVLDTLVHIWITTIYGDIA